MQHFYRLIRAKYIYTYTHRNDATPVAQFWCLLYKLNSLIFAFKTDIAQLKVSDKICTNNENFYFFYLELHDGEIKTEQNRPL